MPTALLATDPSPNERSAMPPALTTETVIPSRHGRREFTPESLLKTSPAASRQQPGTRVGAATRAEAGTALEMSEAYAIPGIFQAFRVALLFNGGLCLMAMLGYEAWMMVTQR